MNRSTRRTAWISAAALALILLWDATGWDLAVARSMGNPGGFPLRDSWLLADLLHSDARYLAWIVVLGLCLSIAWPVGFFRRLPVSRRVQLAASALAASAFVTLLKSASHTSCPWDLHEFGGVARYVSHWSGWRASDGGAGHCFPAGHAASGFAFIGGWFALREDLPRHALAWAAVAIAAGLALGLAQQLRGAHFMSHTLWTGWVCWMTAWLADPLFSPGRAPRLEASA